MNNSFIDKKLTFIIKIAYIIVMIFVFYTSVKYILPIIFPFVTAIGLCYIVEPTVQVLNNKAKIKRPLASAICIIIIIILMFSAVTLITTTLFAQLKSLASTLPDLLNDIELYFNRIRAKDNIGYIEKFISYIYENIRNIDIEKITSMNAFDGVLNYFTGLFKSIPNMILTFIVTFVFSVFLSSSFESVKNFIYKQLSKEKMQILCQIKRSMINIFGKYLKSYFLLMMITFFELSIAFTVFKIKPAFVLSFIISLIDILPIFGVGTIMIPWAIILFILGSYSNAVIILSIYAVITVIRQIIEPKIIGNEIGVPPVITLPAMYIGLKLFGIIGLFISPIIISVIFDLNKSGHIKILK